MTFAKRLNRLFDTVYPPGRRPHTSAEAVAAVRGKGTPMSAPYLSQLRSGKRENPSDATMAALAGFFGVDPAYFTDDDYASQLDQELEALAHIRERRVDLPPRVQRDAIAEIEPNNPASEKASNTAPSSSHLRLKVFADRLNTLFDTTFKQDGIPYSCEEVASALQDDGLPVSASVLNLLRSGIGEAPSSSSIEAIAYFFNVGPEYFTGDPPFNETSGVARTGQDLQHNSVDEPLSTHIVDGTSLQVNHVGICVSALLQASMQRLDTLPPDFVRARRLIALASDLNLLVNHSDVSVDVPRSLLSELRAAWTWTDAAGYVDRALYERIVATS